MEYISAHSPKWRTRTSINLVVLFVGHDSEVPFVAHSDDTDEFNRELFTRASNGEFGEIDLARKGIADIISKDITAYRDKLMMTGGAKVGELWFHSDTHSKVQQLSLMIAGTNLPDGIMWKTMSGEKVLMTPTLAVQIYQAQMMQESLIYGYAESLLSQIDGMEFPETVQIYDGWPEVYR